MAGHRVYIDANLVVYFLDRHPSYFEPVERLIRAAYDRRLVALTGDAAVAEVMVRPYQLANPIQIREIQSFFATRNLLEIRSHSAIAVNAACRYFVTNDAGFATSPEINVVPLQSLLS